MKNIMNVLYTGLRSDRYGGGHGNSFEYGNFYKTLASTPWIHVSEHPYDRILQVGKEQFNAELLERVRLEKPDLLFSFMYTDELDESVLQIIKEKTTTQSMAWFADDYWRFFNYSKYWARYFNWAVTTYSRAVGWYEAAGFRNILRSQWACNTSSYAPLDLPRDIDVSFVGQCKPQRARVVELLRRNGVDVQAFGRGWPRGPVSHEEMIKIFSRSKVNLNLNVRPGWFSPRVIARLFLKKSINNVVPDFRLLDNIRSYWHFPIPHTHARPFELAGCKAFVLSGFSEDILDYYRENEEMVFYRSSGELTDKVKYYLEHDKERERIAVAGYARTLREHTYEARFRELFTKIGLLSAL